MLYVSGERRRVTIGCHGYMLSLLMYVSYTCVVFVSHDTCETALWKTQTFAGNQMFTYVPA